MLLFSLYCQAKALVASRDRGATAAEYAMIVAAVTIAVATVVFVFGDAIVALFDDTCNSITEGNAAGC